jgi:hypothetical protein
MTEGKFAQLYAKARGSKTFLFGLCAIVFTWLGASIVTGFDHDHGLLNLFLSFEASISLAFFAVVSEMQYRVMLELLQTIKQEEDEILKEIDHDV